MTQIDGMGREVGGGSGLGTCVHPCRIHADVWQNQYNIVKLKKNKIKSEKKKNKGDQSLVFIGRTDAEGETPILWPPHAKS